MNPRPQRPKTTRADEPAGAAGAPAASAGRRPVEKPRRLWIFIGAGAAAALLLGIGLFFLFRKPAEKSEEKPIEKKETAKTGTQAPTRSHPSGTPTEEDEARALFEAAKDFEKAHPSESDRISAKYREVLIKYPDTKWADLAEEKHRELDAALQRLFEDRFEAVRLETAAHSKEGRYREARGVLEKFIARTANEVLKRRGEIEIVNVENAARDEYNRAVRKAEEQAKNGDYAGAVATIQAARGKSIEETAPLCDQALADLAAAQKAFAEAQAEKAAQDCEVKFQDQVRADVLPLLKQRKYEDAAKYFDAALARPELAPIKDVLVSDRALVRAAGDFWEAVLKSLRGRANQEIALSLVEGAPASGRLARILPEALILKRAEGEVSLPLDRLHPDQLLLLAIGPESAADSYARAAMFFFCEGREELARLELATAKEMKVPVDGLEKSFRGGPLRAAFTKK